MVIQEWCLEQRSPNFSGLRPAPFSYLCILWNSQFYGRGRCGGEEMAQWSGVHALNVEILGSIPSAVWFPQALPGAATQSLLGVASKTGWFLEGFYHASDWLRPSLGLEKVQNVINKRLPSQAEF